MTDYVDDLKKALGPNKAGTDWMALAREYLTGQQTLILYGPSWFKFEADFVFKFEADFSLPTGSNWREWSEKSQPEIVGYRAPLTKNCLGEAEYPRQDDRYVCLPFKSFTKEQLRSRLYLWMDQRNIRPTTYKVRELEAALAALCLASATTWGQWGELQPEPRQQLAAALKRAREMQEELEKEKAAAGGPR